MLKSSCLTADEILKHHFFTCYSEYCFNHCCCTVSYQIQNIGSFNDSVLVNINHLFSVNTDEKQLSKMRNNSYILPTTVTGKGIVAFSGEEQCILVILIGSSLLFPHPFIPQCCETEQLKRGRIAECRGKDIGAWLAPKWVRDTKSYRCICLLSFLIHLGLKHSLASTLQNHTEVTHCHSQMTPLCYQHHALPIRFCSFCLLPLSISPSLNWTYVSHIQLTIKATQ